MINIPATIILIGGFFLLMAFKIPVTFSMLLSAIASMIIVPGANPTTMVRMMIDGVGNFTMLAIPFFIVMGEIMAAGQISDKIVDLANLAVGRFRGGLAYVNCLDSMFFGGISGSAVADVSSLGSVVIPMMVKQGYDREFTVGLTVTTACQGVLIPPSHNMVIYALAAGTGVSIGQLFYAGFAPGICLGCGFILMCFLLGKKYNFPKGEKMFKDDRVRWIGFNKKGGKKGKMAEGEGWLSIPVGSGALELGKCMKVTLSAILPMFTLIIILVGTGMGIFTATESSAVACFYTFILTYFIFRADKIRNFFKVIKNSLKTLAIVLTLIATAKAFAYMMTLLQIPAAMTNALIGISSNPYVIFFIINILLLILGCFMDMAPLIMIMTPILLPVVQKLGMTDVHFGIIIIFNLAIGLCTPPVGSALFVGCAVGKTTIENTAKKMLPLFTVMVILLLVFTYVPFMAKIPLFGYEKPVEITAVAPQTAPAAATAAEAPAEEPAPAPAPVEEDSAIVRTYSYAGYELTATIDEGSAVLEYPAFITDAEAEAFIAVENARYGYGDMGVVYSLEGEGIAQFTYPAELDPEMVAAEVDNLFEDLVAYVGPVAEEAVVKTYSYAGYELTATIEDGSIVLAYPSFVTDDEVNAFFAYEDGVYGFSDLGVSYAFGDAGSLTLTYPAEYTADVVAAELDGLVDDLIEYVSAL